MPLWLLLLWLSASIFILVMRPHLRNEGFFIGFIVVWATANSSYSCCPYFVCPLEFTGQRERGVRRIITLLPALSMFWLTFVLFQRLWLFVTTLHIFCCLICHQAGQLVEFLKLAASSTRTQRSSGLLLLISLSWILFFYLWSLQSHGILKVAALSPHLQRSSIFHFLHGSCSTSFCSFDVETSFCFCGKWCSWARS